MVLLIVLGLVFAISSGDRALLGILKTTLAQGLGFSQSEYAALVATLLLPYALMLLVSGSLINRHGPRVVLAICLIVMSVSTALASGATRYAHLFAPQLALGLAQACVAPSVAYLILTLLPPARHALGYSTINAIQSAATILCPAYVAAVTLTFGWRHAFAFLSVAGLGMAAAWWIISWRWDPPRVEQAAGISLAQVWRNPAIRALIVARMITDPFWFFLQFWQTAFLQEKLGATLAQIGRLAWIPPAAAVAGVFLAGAVSDRLIARGWSTTKARLAPMAAVALLAPAIVIIPSITSLNLAIALCALAYLMCAVWLSLSAVLLGSLAPRAELAPALGITSALGCLSGIIFNLLAGPLIERWGYAPLFWIGACLHPVAILVLRRAARTEVAIVAPALS